MLSEYTLLQKQEQVKEFCYLVSMITTDAKCHMEVKGSTLIEKRHSQRGIRRNG